MPATWHPPCAPLAGSAGPDPVEAALGEVLEGFEAQRQALVEGDAEAVHAATVRLESRVARLRQALPRGSAEGASPLPARLHHVLLALRQLAQSNASLLLRRGGQANAAIEHLAQAAPPLERRRLTSTYAPAGAVNAGTPLTRVLGRA